MDEKDLKIIELREELKKYKRTGAWVWKENGYKCSLCSNYVYGSLDEIYSGNYKYCPYCGARLVSDE